MEDHEREEATVALLSFNDVYRLGSGDEDGIVAMADAIDRRRAAARDRSTVVFGCGDFMTADACVSSEPGKCMVRMLAALGVECAVPGNHEFDWGADVFAARVRESPFAWVCANAIDGSAGRSSSPDDSDGREEKDDSGDADPKGAPLFGGLLPWKILCANPGGGGVRMGVVGVCTPDTATISLPGPGVRFADPIEAARRAVAAMRAEGVDAVVALTHLTWAEDRALMAAVPEIDVALGGHDHEPGCVWVDGRPVVKAGSNWSHVAIVEIVALRPRGARPLVASVRLEAVRGGGAPRSLEGAGTCGARVRALAAEAALASGPARRSLARADEVLATVAGPCGLDSRGSRERPCSFAHVVADALHEAYDEALRPGAGLDLFLINGGSIRGDRTYAPGHPFTGADLERELPFRMYGVVRVVSARGLVEALEHSIDGWAGGRASTRFLHLSRGWRVVYDDAAPRGSRVVRVERDGLPLDADATVRVATIAYLARGGDGFVTLAAGDRVPTPLDDVLLAETLAGRMRFRGRLAAPDGSEERWARHRPL
jgi:5'-nucleotidase